MGLNSDFYELIHDLSLGAYMICQVKEKDKKIYQAEETGRKWSEEASCNLTREIAEAAVSGKVSF